VIHVNTDRLPATGPDTGKKENRNFCRIIVSDNGIGFDAKYA
jgi:hypothetical protein